MRRGAPPAWVADARRSRRHPSPTQFDYLHLRYVLRHLQLALDALPPPRRVLDIYCGSRPYDDLLGQAQVVGLDVDDSYGVADVVSTEFLPFEGESFDLVLCMEALHYVRDPQAAVHEIARVLAPGGAAIVAVPYVWEYDEQAVEHRFTGPGFAALFDGWGEVRVSGSGGRAVTWALLTGRMIDIARETAASRSVLPSRGVGAIAGGLYATINAAAMAIDRIERRMGRRRFVLPCNIQVVARKAPVSSAGRGPVGA